MFAGTVATVAVKLPILRLLSALGASSRTCNRSGDGMQLDLAFFDRRSASSDPLHNLRVCPEFDNMIAVLTPKMFSLFVRFRAQLSFNFCF